MFKILSSLLFLFCCSASKQARVCRAWMGPLPPWPPGPWPGEGPWPWGRQHLMLLSAWMTRGFLHFFLFLCSTTNLTLNNFYVDISQHRSLIIILNKCTRTSCRAPSAWCRSALCGRTWAGRASSCASSPGTSSWAAQATWWTGSAGTAPRLSSACSRSTLPARTSTLETKFGDVTVQIKCKSLVTNIRLLSGSLM